MSIQLINIGTLANDGTGDNLRAAFVKTNNNFVELYNLTLTSNTQAISTVAIGNTLAKRDTDGNLFANRLYHSNLFTGLSSLPSAAAHSGMLVYVSGEGFRASNGTEWVKGFESGLSTQLNGLVVGTPEKIKKLNFTGINIHATVDQSDAEKINVSVDAAYSNTTTTTTVAAAVIDTFSAISVKAAKYLVHITAGSNVYFTEISVLNYGTAVDIIEYGSMGSLSDINGDPVKPGEFSAVLNGSQVELIFTPTTATNTIRLNRYSILN